MTEEFVPFFEKTGYHLRRLNEQFYFYFDFETYISWLVILLLFLLYRIVSSYLSDKKLTSDELLKLILCYLLILLIVIASYANLAILFDDPRRDSQFVVFLVILITLIVLVARLGVSEDANKKKNWILLILFTPLLLIIFTNGAVLENWMGSVRYLIPRSNATFIGLPGEFERLRVGGIVSPVQTRRMQEIIERYPGVKQSALVSRRDADGLIKPYALVVLSGGPPKSEKSLKYLEEDIITYVFSQTRKADHDVELLRGVILVHPDQMPGTREQYPRLNDVIEYHRAVDEAVIIQERKPEDTFAGLYAYVIVRPEYLEADPHYLEKNILEFTNRRIGKTFLSTYLVPRWIEFVDADFIPKTGEGAIDYRVLQKKRRNWSELFRTYETD